MWSSVACYLNQPSAVGRSQRPGLLMHARLPEGGVLSEIPGALPNWGEQPILQLTLPLRSMATPVAFGLRRPSKVVTTSIVAPVPLLSDAKQVLRRPPAPARTNVDNVIFRKPSSLAASFSCRPDVSLIRHRNNRFRGSSGFVDASGACQGSGSRCGDGSLHVWPKETAVFHKISGISGSGSLQPSLLP